MNITSIGNQVVFGSIRPSNLPKAMVEVVLKNHLAAKGHEVFIKSDKQKQINWITLSPDSRKAGESTVEQFFRACKDLESLKGITLDLQALRLKQVLLLQDIRPETCEAILNGPKVGVYRYGQHKVLVHPAREIDHK